MDQIDVARQQEKVYERNVSFGFQPPQKKHKKTHDKFCRGRWLKKN